MLLGPVTLSPAMMRASVRESSAVRAPSSPETAATSATASDPAAAQAESAGQARLEQLRLRQEQLEIRDLAARDREVRSHEQAHAAAGGALAGSPSYSYVRGPDGRNYVTGGEVSIDSSPVPGDPQATLAKMEQVRRAALAPAEPSAQDLKVAAQAQAQAAQARGELAKMQALSAETEPAAGATAQTDPYAAQGENEGRERLGTRLDARA